MSMRGASGGMEETFFGGPDSPSFFESEFWGRPTLLHPAESFLRIGRRLLASDVPKLSRPLAKIFVGESKSHTSGSQDGSMWHLDLDKSGALTLVPSTCRQQPPTLQARFVGPLNFSFTRCTIYPSSLPTVARFYPTSSRPSRSSSKAARIKASSTALCCHPSLPACHVPQVQRTGCHRLMPSCSVAGGISRVGSRVLYRQVPISTTPEVALLPSTSYISPSPTPPAEAPPSPFGEANGGSANGPSLNEILPMAHPGAPASADSQDSNIEE